MKSIKDIRLSSQNNKKLLNDLSQASVEKGIENAYWKAVKESFNTEINDNDNTDGYIDLELKESTLFMLLEFKYDKELKKRNKAMEVIVQALFYMHNIREEQGRVPNMLMIGDKYNAFVVSTKNLLKYLEYDDVDWTIAPSRAKDKYKRTLVVDLYNDHTITYYVHEVNENFSFNDLINDIAMLISETDDKIKLTPSSINVAFDHFINNVILNQNQFSPEELVDFFITLITNRKDVFANDETGTLVIHNQQIRINKYEYQSFINHFKSEYSPSEVRKFTETADRLIQDISRRRNGEFYTPSAFVDYAYQRLSKILGSSWKDDCVVWDPAWGTGNLTRDAHFSKLFASTLNQSDLNMAAKYNQDAAKFQFDFLRDDLDFENDTLFTNEYRKLPDELAEILINHPDTKFLFFLNPPYATAGNANAKSKKSKAGIATTPLRDEMKAKHLKVQEQLYAQFLYRIIKIKEKMNLTNVYIGLFSPSLLLTGSKFKEFRKLLLDNFEFKDGNLFQASNFADVKNNWAIDFSIWKGHVKSKDIERYEFTHNILSLNSMGTVEIIDNKLLYNTDDPETVSLQDFLKINTSVPNKLSVKKLQFKSRYKYSETIDVPQNALGYLINDTNNVEAATKGVYLMSSPITRHIKTALITENHFADQMVVFAARKVIPANWINQKDEFIAPNINSSLYAKMQLKSVIYSIFSPNNNIISYRSSLNNDGTSNINQWFFMSNKEIKELVDVENGNADIYQDTIEFAGDRFVYRFLKNKQNLLDKADQELLSVASKIVEQTMPYRAIFNEEYPEFSVNTWDASWDQIMQVAKEYGDNEQTALFKQKFKDYTTAISEMVYQLGILK